MLEIRTLTTGDEPLLEAFLTARMASSFLLIANSRLAGLVDRGEPFEGTYAGAFDDGVLVGVAAHYWNGNTIVQAPSASLALCRQAVEESGRALAGLLGPNAQVAEILAGLRIEPARLRLDSVESLFQLPLAELCVPPQLASGEVRVRTARRQDLERLIEWRVAYSVEALHEDDGEELQAEVRRSMEHAIDEVQIWIAEHAGAPVAMTSFNAVSAGTAQVGGVFTPPALRGRGFARAVVAQSLLDARAAGVRTGLLFTGDDNPAAQRAYRALGFERIGDYRLSMLVTPIAADALGA